MCISIRFTAPKAACVDDGLDTGHGRVIWIELKSTVDVLEVTPDVGHHHVLHAELRSRMSGFEYPPTHWASRFPARSRGFLEHFPSLDVRRTSE